MPKFMFAYHGGNKPEGEAAQAEAMGRWVAWMEKYSDHLADRGAPVGMSTTVSADGVENNGGANPISGYSLIEAADLDAAVAMAKECPIIVDGGSIEIAPIMAM
ncbi:MAG: YciI family protein [Neomegalonema sp.]|nr:YciI family protein [Neomegalonema sp.]